MPDCKTMYFNLAAKMADAVELLIEAQQQGEDTYIESADAPPIKIADVVDKNTEKAPTD